MSKLQIFIVSQVITAAILIAACETKNVVDNQVVNRQAIVQEIISPAEVNSAEPELSATGGEILLSWIEGTKETSYALRFASFANDKWSEPNTVATGKNWFVNWADFASVVRLPDKSLVAHWLVVSAKKNYAYDVFVARSFDNGKTWSTAIRPHTDNTPTEHGFVSLFPWTNNRAGAIWLDGRKFSQPEKAASAAAPQFIKIHNHGHETAVNEMTLRFAAVDADGKLSDEAELDNRVCDCCQTAAAMTDQGAIVVYRDRSQDEKRDVSIVRHVNGRWTEPQTVFADNWQINACPVNGPALAADGRRVAVAWFTNVENRSQVKIVFSKDAGTTFSQPLEIASGNNAGRVDVVLLGDDSALVTWLDGAGNNAAIKARRVFSNGKQSESLTIANTTAARSSGFPRVARAGENVIFAWTESTAKDAPTRVRTAVLKLGAR